MFVNCKTPSNAPSCWVPPSGFFRKIFLRQYWKPRLPRFLRGLAPLNYHEGVTRLKKELILTAVEKAGGSVTEAAMLLGVHPNYLHRLIRNLDLRSLVTKD